MAPVGTLERTTFECARCGETIDRSTRPRTCPHCQAKKADRCQLCDRAVYIGVPRCPDHAELAPGVSDRPTAMLPSAPPTTQTLASPAPRWVAAVARTAIAVSLLAPAGWVARTHSRLRTASSYDDLRALLVDDVPAAYTRIDDAAAGTGPADLEQVVHDDIEGPAAREALTDAGLLRGYTRAWKRGDTDALGVEVYQHSSSEGADMEVARAERLAPMYARAHQVSWQTFAVPTVPGAHGYHFNGAGGGPSVDVVTFGRGSYSVAVSVMAADAAQARRDAVEVAERQRARLSKAERLELLVTDGLQKVRG